MAGHNPNWTEILGSVAAVVNSQNSQYGRGKNDVSAYEAVYGQVQQIHSVNPPTTRPFWLACHQPSIGSILGFTKKSIYISANQRHHANQSTVAP
jgi:hypothetical protein